MTFTSGVNATATIGGVEPAIKKWEVKPTAEIVKIANSKTGRFRQKFATFFDATFTLTIDQDLDSDPFASPLNLNIGQVLTNVLLYVSSTKSSPTSAPSGGPFWTFPSAVIVGTPQTAEVEGMIQTTIECEANGTFTYPDGYVPGTA